MPIVAAADLRTALSAATYVAIFDDKNTGEVKDDDPGVTQVLRRAHAEVVSWIFPITSSDPNAATQSDLLFSVELDFAVAFAFERHPGYVRSFGEEVRAARMSRATAKMKRIQEGLQRYSVAGSAAEAMVPTTAGGFVESDAEHVFDE